MAEAVAEVGSTANNYQILARLATGGMAEIFLARGVSATGVERHCVLKRILRNRASDVQFVRMFLDEARLAAQLNHPNVAQVYDIGKLGDSYFFTMEYVHGETVRAIMQRARSLRRDVPLAAILTITAGAAAGLHHAHERIGIDGRPLNIVHRDVSPSNLMVSYEGSVKVVDFGVAKAADRANETRSGTVKGKISYLSPEQARGLSSIDRRADMFSLGIVLWEMLTTERLYKRSSDFENMTAIVNEPTPAPSTRRKWVPPELDAICLRLLDKDPAKRFQTADDVIEALERFAGRSGTMISSSALARYMRDVFGQRPEPWIELDTAEVPEGVTVTSEPIPAELAIPVADNMDLQLANVPKLQRTDEQPVAQVHDDHVPIPTPATQMLTAARPTSMPEDQLPTTPHPKIANDMLSTLNDSSPPPPRPSPNPRASALGASPFVPPAPNSTSTIAGHVPASKSGPQPRLQLTPSQPKQLAIRETVTSYPTVSGLGYQRATPTPDEPPRRVGWQLFTVIAIAAVIGSATMWYLMRGRNHAASEKSVDAQVVQVVEIDASVVQEVDAAEPVVADVPIDAAVVEIDAAEPMAVDAAAPVAEPKPSPTAKPKPKKSEIEQAFEDGRYKDVLARCTKLPTGPDETRCVLAACRTGNETKARALFAKVSDKTKRKQYIVACKGSNVDLVPDKPDKPDKDKPDKPDKPDCEANPMACQH